jgi:Xaa-Pro aminopeptidase
MAGRHERALEIANELGVDAVLVAKPESVTWLTGYAPPFGTAPNPWSSPALALVSPDGALLIVADDQCPTENACPTATYPGYGLGKVDRVTHLKHLLGDLIDGRLVAIEADTLPVAVSSDLTWVDAAEPLASARAVKDPDELELIARAVEVADIGQRAVRRAVSEGLSEIELWNGTQAAMEAAGGANPASMSSVIVRPSLARFGGAPGYHIVNAGDVVLADLVPCVAGYWADSCSAVAVGTPTKAARRAYSQVSRRLQSALDIVKPGLRSGDLDAFLRDGLYYPHHSGHGVGTSFHEEPRIVPRGRSILKDGMVIAIEPAQYTEQTGVRLEVLLRVTSDGCEVLSHHDVGHEGWSC